MPPSPTAAAYPPDIDLFCRVIDNYGDIGVCWRLARQLAHERNQHVRLWVDNLSSFARLEPAVRTTVSCQHVQGIEVCHWHDGVHWPTPATRVIEAFGCDLPAAYVAQLGPAQRWFNLEYLSAEPWVESCHGLPSPQAGGLEKRFVFPGFSSRTGGLLREASLLQRRDQWQSQPAQHAALWRSLGLAPGLAESAAGGEHRVALLFCYPQAPVHALLQALQNDTRPWVVLLAGGSGANTPPPTGAPLTLHPMPFVNQETFDKILWTSNLNLVRGEDSFVRAQWAARPLLWHIYPQQDGSHHAKLEAWLQRANVPAAWQTLHRRWNASPSATLAGHDLTSLTDPTLQQHARQWAQAWANEAAQLPELTDCLLT